MNAIRTLASLGDLAVAAAATWGKPGAVLGAIALRTAGVLAVVASVIEG